MADGQAGRGWRGFLGDEEGSATAEVLLWLPLVFALLVLITDACFVFGGRAQAVRLVQDGNRAYSVGRYESAGAAAAAIKASLARLSPNATVTSAVSGGVVTTTAALPIDDLVVFGTVASLSGYRTTVTSQHFLEN